MSERKFDRRTPVIAIDFDGVLCTDRYPEIGEPNVEVIREARMLRQIGVCLILWTSRTGKDLEAAVEACRDWGLEFDAVNENPQFRIDLFNGSDPRKVGADEYWDDKSVYVGTGKPGAWRHLHGITTNRTPVSTAMEKARQFINGPLSAEAEYLRGLSETVDKDTANLYSGLIMMLSECRELMEVFMAELSEPPSIHSWYREGYKAATENAADWFTRFLKESGMVGEGDGGNTDADQ